MPLTEKDYEQAAGRLGVEVAAIKAVAEVESRGEGFNADGTPKILFERHYFHTLTFGRYSGTHPHISNEKSGGYGKSADQHKRLQQAAALDRAAALQSASWGKFQVLGVNWARLKYTSLQEFINAMYRDEAAHLDSFVRFVEANKLVGALRTKNWKSFAAKYNGPNYRVNKYDTKMAQAYARHRKAA